MFRPAGGCRYWRIFDRPASHEMHGEPTNTDFPHFVQYPPVAHKSGQLTGARFVRYRRVADSSGVVNDGSVGPMLYSTTLLVGLRCNEHVTKPYEFIGFGAVAVTKPYE